ncbi:MAG: class C beta-lactamase, partial [Comamonadaceae bacterium]
MNNIPMTSTIQRRTVLSALGALTLPACALPPARAPLTTAALATAVDAAYQPLLQEHAIDGMVVGITEGGRSHFFSYGVAARGNPAQTTPETIFELGSLSKCFTATLAAHAQA